MVTQIKGVEPREETEAYMKVLHWFFAYPGKEMSLNDLSQELEISKKTANGVVMKLLEAGFLRREVLGRIWRLSCNPNSGYNVSRKIGYNLTLIYESEIRKMIWELVPNSKSIILFGSYRKGDDTEKSDIDIAVEVLGDKEMSTTHSGSEIMGVIPQLGYRKKVPVHLHIFSRNKVDLNVFANIANGIVLEGFLEVRP